METDENKNIETPENEQKDDVNFIQEFIDRKKLENRVLRELIEQLNHSENHNKTTDKE